MSDNPNLDHQDLTVEAADRIELMHILSTFPYGATSGARSRAFPGYRNGQNQLDFDGLIAALTDLREAVQQGINSHNATQIELEEFRAQRSAIRAFLGHSDEN